MKVRQLHGAGDLSPEAWDALAGGDVVFSHGWLRALEQAGELGIEPRHLVCEDEDGAPVALIPGFLQHRDPYGPLGARLFGSLEPLGAALGAPARPAWVACSPLAQRTEVLLKEGVDEGAVLRSCLRHLAERCVAGGIALSGFPFVPEGRFSLQHALREAGYRRAFLAPVARWHNEGGSFEQWVTNLRRIGRRRVRSVRNELNRARKSGAKLEEMPLSALDPEELARQHAVFWARRNAGEASPLGAPFFAALADHLGDRAMLHVARLDGAVLGWSMVLCGTRRWHMFLSGEADADALHRDALRAALDYYFPIERALERGIPELDYGLSTYERKLLRGCLLDPLYIHVRGHTRAARTVLAMWMPVVDRRYRAKHRELTRSARSMEPLIRPSLPWWRRVRSLLVERQTFVVTTAPLEKLAEDLVPTSLQVRLLQPQETESLDAVEEGRRRDLYRNFRAGGYLCFGAFDGDRMAGHLWVTDGDRHYGPYFGWRPLARQAAFVGFSYVEPAYRGRRVASILRQRVAAVLQRRGARVLHSGIHEHNAASLRANAFAGVRPVRLWRYLRVGPWTRRTSGPLPPEHPAARPFVEAGLRVEETGIPVPELGRALPGPAGTEEAWTPGDPLRRQAWRYLRRHGALGLVRRIGDRALRLAWDRAIIYELTVPLHPEASFPSPARREGVEVRRLGPECLDLLEPITSRGMFRQFERFVAEGFECYGAFLDGSISAYNWYTRRPYFSEDLQATLPLGPDEAYLVFSHTLQATRGRDLDRTVKAHAFTQMQRRGVRALRTIVLADNRAALWLTMRWGGRLSRRYRYRRVLGRRRLVAEPVTPTPELVRSLVGREPEPYEGVRPASETR